MRNHLIIPTLLLAASQLGAAITPGRLGLCLGNTFANNSLKGYGDFVADLQAIKKLAPDVKLVRTYGAGGKPNSTAQSILKAAKQEGFQVLLGTW
jgi:exo-beta-1,3-glucanase (GH17 family)